MSYTPTKEILLILIRNEGFYGKEMMFPATYEQCNRCVVAVGLCNDGEYESIKYKKAMATFLKEYGKEVLFEDLL